VQAAETSHFLPGLGRSEDFARSTESASRPRGRAVEQIKEHRRATALFPGEELDGVGCAIDAVGFHRSRPEIESPGQVISDNARLVNPDGVVGIAGVYTKDSHPPEGARADGRLTVPWAMFFANSVRIGFGRTDDRRYTTFCGTWCSPGAPILAAS
jgi:glutathione-independent formaldehyde dehydrogenase